MKEKLPFLFIATWIIIGGFSNRVAALVGGVLLSLAILLGMVSAVQGDRRRQGAAIVAIGVVLYIGSVVFHLLMADSESGIALQLSAASVQADFRQSAIDHRWAAFAYLLSLAGVLIGGAVVLGGPKAWHRWLTSR